LKSRDNVPTAEGLSRLVEALRVLPGVGPRSAQRMAYHLLQHDRAGAGALAEALGAALQTVRRCDKCNNFSEEPVCALCRSTRRDPALLCVVETPADLAMVEQTLSYSGMYFVLMGRLSPLDGVGPRDIGLDRLQERIAAEVQEVILATNFTAEGEATAHVIAEALKQKGLKVTRLARGVPAGSELEYVDLGTIAHALVDRRTK